METLTSSATIVSSPSSLPVFSPRPKDPSSSRRFLRFSKKNGNDPDLRSDSSESSLAPILSNQTLSKDAAMGLVLSAANVRGWTTGSGMEGPPVPAGADSGSGTERVSTFPWSLFTKSPRRRMRVAFTCNCCGCNVFHKLVDNLNLFHEMKCYVNPSFNYRGPKGDASFKYLDMDDDSNDIFPLL
ncbi:hypothetical protein RJ639_028609 [Escallonia herrerae]|uniref:DNL-type domain-containing protein n=1 Tax=Escallonia herrerae TaxID=1293975 RepID=A0AA88X3D3_9ASTE|nr:hypothetical protein RJ639_028609 [Escallonia herrerae]